MKGLRQTLRVSWNAKKQMSGFLTKAGVKRELLDTVKARKLAYCGHTGAHRRGRPRTTWMDIIRTWKGLPVEESVRMTEDSDKWRNYVHDVANPRIEDG